MNRHKLDWEVSGAHAAGVLAATGLVRDAEPGQLHAACVALCEGGPWRNSRRIGRLLAQAGQVIFEQGAFADTLYVVETGRLQVLLTAGPDRQQQIHIAYLGPTDVFGEAVIAHERQRTATVKAIMDSVLLVLHEDAVKELMRQFPSISTAILRLMVERQAELEARARSVRSRR